MFLSVQRVGISISNHASHPIFLGATKTVWLIHPNVHLIHHRLHHCPISYMLIPVTWLMWRVSPLIPLVISSWWISIPWVESGDGQNNLSFSRQMLGVATRLEVGVQINLIIRREPGINFLQNMTTDELWLPILWFSAVSNPKRIYMYDVLPFKFLNSQEKFQMRCLKSYCYWIDYPFTSWYRLLLQ